MKPVVLAPLVAVALAGGSAGAYFWLTSEGSVEEAAVTQPTPTPSEEAPTPSPAPEGQLWRWVNVTVIIPEGSGVYVVQDYYGGEVNPPDGGPVMTLSRDTNPSNADSSSLLIDAEDGTILRENVLPDDRGAIDQVLLTLRVSPLNPATAPWPYNGQPSPDLQRERVGNISYIIPAPESGILVYGVLSDPGGEGLNITNGRSAVGVDVLTGLPYEEGRIQEEDSATFERYLATIKVCGQEAAC